MTNTTKHQTIMKINKIIYCIALIAITSVTITSCSGCSDNKKEYSSNLSKVICDESFKNILDEEIQVFEYQYRDKNTSVLPLYLDEASALDSLLDGKVNVIITYRDLTLNQKRILKGQNRAYRSKRIAVDAIALIVNKDNDIDYLSMNDIQDILTGKSTKWGEVYPTKLKDEPIHVVFDRNGSGVVHYMKDKFNNGKDFPIEYFAQGSSQAVFDLVEKDKNAIGIIGVSWITDDMKSTVKPIEERFADLEKSGSVEGTSFTDKIKVLGVRKEDVIRDY
ncbi:MAG: substrate-binding domain-containing protein, partial [Bacteroidaceae bacterium]|nr:substrate-binding domain-containing protein [Bacteroidaceae bacterium]